VNFETLRFEEASATDVSCGFPPPADRNFDDNGNLRRFVASRYLISDPAYEYSARSRYKEIGEPTAVNLTRFADPREQWCNNDEFSMGGRFYKRSNGQINTFSLRRTPESGHALDILRKVPALRSTGLLDAVRPRESVKTGKGEFIFYDVDVLPLPSKTPKGTRLKAFEDYAHASSFVLVREGKVITPTLEIETTDIDHGGSHRELWDVFNFAGDDYILVINFNNEAQIFEVYSGGRNERPFQVLRFIYGGL